MLQCKLRSKRGRQIGKELKLKSSLWKVNTDSNTDRRPLHSFEKGLMCPCPQRDRLIRCPLDSITRQKLCDTFSFRCVVNESEAKQQQKQELTRNPFSSPVSDGCFTSHTTAEESARLTQSMTKTLFDLNARCAIDQNLAELCRTGHLRGRLHLTPNGGIPGVTLGELLMSVPKLLGAYP